MTLKFFAKDAAGNVESVKTEAYSFDTAGPVGTITINGGSARTNNAMVTLTLSANDPSGISQMQFSTDGSTWSTPETYNTTKTLMLLSPDGSKTAYVKFKDGLGTWSEPCTISTILDTTLPVTTANPIGGTYASAQTVTLTANEGATIYYTTDGTTPTEGSTVYSDPISIPSTAAVTLMFFAKDAAGNIESVKTENYSLLKIVPGDLDDNGRVDLADVLLALQVIAKRSSVISPHINNGINGDGKIGLPDAIYILQKTAGVR